MTLLDKITEKVLAQIDDTGFYTVRCIQFTT